ncbi:hypothetical protein DERP_006076 [Dermatophagoides pteronyssinus]|uniref:Secreted protein n=1 Tax=Dermatophagoides pteronyssinus TaxID=6956 RepID=A0ABQ8JS83_DERPT|nr:hypothetical protein DERP_006076 [Dermatophagoides pteronyssinus]
MLKISFCSISAFNLSARAAFIFVIIEPTLPTIVANIKTPIKKFITTNVYSKSVSGIGTSPIVVNNINFAIRNACGKFVRVSVRSKHSVRR